MIDVVVVAYRSAAIIGGCLEGVQSIPDVDRVTVVDHSGDVATAAIVQAAGANLIVDETNPGFGAGQNRGMAAGSAEYVLLLNPDAHVDGAAIGHGAGVLASRPDVALVQGTVASAQGGGPERSRGREITPVHLWGRTLHLRRLLSFRMIRSLARRLPSVADHVDRAAATSHEVEWLAATVVLARRAAIEDVGGFDDAHYFLYGEDLDLCRRLRDAGWKLLAVPDLWATHVSGASSSTSWHRETEWWRGTMTFAARWWSRPRFAAALGAAGVQWVQLAGRRPTMAASAWDAVVRSGWRARRSPASARARPSRP